MYRILNYDEIQRKLLPPAVLKLHPLAVLRVSSSHLRVSGLQRYLSYLNEGGNSSTLLDHTMQKNQEQ